MDKLCAFYPSLSLGKLIVQWTISPVNGLALGLETMQGEQWLKELRTPLHGSRGWVKTDGLNAQYREVLLRRYPSEAGARSVGANEA